MKFHLRRKTKMDIHFRPKNENESHLIILVFFKFFFIHSVTKSALQYLVQFRLFAVVLVDGIPLSSCTVYRYLSIFLDDISTHEQFAFLVFHNLCTMLYKLLAFVWPDKYPPLLNTSQMRLMCIVQKILSNNGFRMANCFCCLSQNATVCLAHCRQELQQKS